MSAPSIFGIIPARAGSKRLPGKNLKKLGGMSLLEHTIRQAKKALPVSIVSTEDPAITVEANRCGVSVLLRPDALATDTATSADVVKHACAAYIGFDRFCLLQVTSPLRLAGDIINCVEIAVSSGRPVVSTYQGKPNGAIYIGDVLRFDGDFLQNAMFYEMPRERSIDIDTQENFDEAERIYNANQVRATP